MCGQAGMIFGPSPRKAAELTRLTGLFTNVLEQNEKRGRHATGVALVKTDGSSVIHKNVMPASRFVHEPTYVKTIRSLDNDTTVLMGHTRWATVGDPNDPANAHPIQAGAVKGTANGTVTNADWLFRRFKLQRDLDVDSEIIFRFAEKCVDSHGRINLQSLATRLSLCRGSLAAVMTATTDPTRIIMAKANKPIDLMYHARYRVVFYASDIDYIKRAIRGERGWMEMEIPRNTIVSLDAASLEIAEMVPMKWEIN